MASTSYRPLTLLLLALCAAHAPGSTASHVSSFESRPSSHPLPLRLLVHVVDSASHKPLPNAEVTASTARRLTDAQGNARLTWPDSGVLRIRVRQIGFRYVDRTVHRGTSPTATEDTVTVVLSSATFALPQVVTEADVRCDEKLDSATFALSTATMELLRFGAEQYNSFREAYPFNVSIARRTVRSPVMRGPRVEEVLEKAESETYGDRYTPGHVLLRTPTGYYVPILFVSTLADTAFWARHCFAARGVQSRDGRRMIKLDFSPARGVRTPEWAGSAWLDSAASALRRVDFHLVNVRDARAPKRFEGYTTFAMPSPYIAVPDSTVAWWWSINTPTAADDRFTADVMQFISAKEMTWRKGEPPAPQPH